MNTLGKFLKVKRIQQNLTQEQVAEEALLARSYLSRLEDDKVKSPSAIVLIRLANALKVSHDEIFSASGYVAHVNDGYPSMGIYLRTKYPSLSDEAIKHIELYKDYIIEKYGK